MQALLNTLLGTVGQVGATVAGAAVSSALAPKQEVVYQPKSQAWIPALIIGGGMIFLIIVGAVVVKARKKG